MDAMPLDRPYTRREGDQLAARVDAIDRNGTRGWQLLTDRVDQQSKAIGSLRDEVSARFREHTRQHDADSLARTVSRRWRIGAAIVAVAAAATVLGLLVAILAQLGHH